MIQCLQAKNFNETRIFPLMEKIAVERDEQIEALSIQKGWVFLHEHQIIGLLSILPYIETAGSIYYTAQSNTCHVSRIVLVRPFPLSILLRAFYAASNCDCFAFPLKLTSTPIPTAERFNQRLGLRPDHNGVYYKVYQSKESLPYWQD